MCMTDGMHHFDTTGDPACQSSLSCKYIQGNPHVPIKTARVYIFACMLIYQKRTSDCDVQSVLAELSVG